MAGQDDGGSVKLSELERKALEPMAQRYSSDMDCLYFRSIAYHSGIPEKKIRRVVRSLARKGLAECVHGLFNEDGEVAGSGYRCTFEGYCAARPHPSPSGGEK